MNCFIVIIGQLKLKNVRFFLAFTEGNSCKSYYFINYTSMFIYYKFMSICISNYVNILQNMLGQYAVDHWQ